VRLMRRRERRCCCSAAARSAFRTVTTRPAEAVTARTWPGAGCSHSPHRQYSDTARNDRRESRRGGPDRHGTGLELRCCWSPDALHMPRGHFASFSAPHRPHRFDHRVACRFTFPGRAVTSSKAPVTPEIAADVPASDATRFSAHGHGWSTKSGYGLLAYRWRRMGLS